jgi:pimeloyl-ACP methyl ester carboxylesterase
MPSLTHNGATINYGDSGSGTPLVLLHAAGSSGGLWRNVAPHFTDRFRVITPDLYGHGRTDFWPEPESLRHDHQAELVRAVLDEVGADCVHMVGHSYGGATGIRYTLDRPAAVRSLIVIEPMMLCLLEENGETEILEDLYVMSKGFLQNLETGGPEVAWREFLDFRNGKGTWEGYPEKTRANFIKRTEGQVANLHANMQNRTTLAEIASITAPSLAIRSEHATSFDGRMTEIVAETVPGCASVTLEDTAHMSPLTDPDKVAAAIERHIA